MNNNDFLKSRKVSNKPQKTDAYNRNKIEFKMQLLCVTYF